MKKLAYFPNIGIIPQEKNKEGEQLMAVAISSASSPITQFLGEHLDLTASSYAPYKGRKKNNDNRIDSSVLEEKIFELMSWLKDCRGRANSKHLLATANRALEASHKIVAGVKTNDRKEAVGGMLIVIPALLSLELIVQDDLFWQDNESGVAIAETKMKLHCFQGLWRISAEKFPLRQNDPDDEILSAGLKPFLEVVDSRRKLVVWTTTLLPNKHPTGWILRPVFYCPKLAKDRLLYELG